MTGKLLDFIAEQLADPETAWSVGSFGVIAEFMREPDEPTKVVRGHETISAATDKGAIRITAHPQLRPFASKSLTTQAWSQCVTVMASLMLRALPRSGTPVALAFALLGAYVGYEIVLFAVTPFLGGEGAFTAAIIGRLGALSAFWLVGLVAAAEIVRIALKTPRQVA